MAHVEAYLLIAILGDWVKVTLAFIEYHRYGNIIELGDGIGDVDSCIDLCGTIEAAVRYAIVVALTEWLLVTIKVCLKQIPLHEAEVLIYFVI